MPTFTDRVLFNWGFWEARADVERKRAPLWRTLGGRAPVGAYADGYTAGADPAHQNDTTSDAAWKARATDIEQRRAAERALRNARPETRAQRY